MSAAFGATRDVNGDSVAGKRHVARNLGRKRAGCDQSVRAKRRPRTGGDAAARIGWLRNETETSCRLLCCRSICLAERPEQESAAERRPGPVCAARLRHPGKLCQRFGLGMTEGKPDTESEHSVLERMTPDGV